MLALSWTLFASACSSLGGIELQDGAEGRFTAGDDEAPPGGDDGDRPSAPSDGDHGTSDGHDGDDPLQPRPDTSDTTGDDTSAGDDDTGSDGTAGATEPAADDGPGATDDDGGTTSDPPTNGVESAGSTGESGDCTDAECLPVCDPTWDTWCGQPCDEGQSACAAEGGIVVSCDAGVWTCAR
jgi:hypothetical protein